MYFIFYIVNKQVISNIADLFINNNWIIVWANSDEKKYL